MHSTSQTPLRRSIRIANKRARTTNHFDPYPVDHPKEAPLPDDFDHSLEHSNSFELPSNHYKRYWMDTYDDMGPVHDGGDQHSFTGGVQNMSIGNELQNSSDAETSVADTYEADSFVTNDDQYKEVRTPVTNPSFGDAVDDFPTDKTYSPSPSEIADDEDMDSYYSAEDSALASNMTSASDADSTGSSSRKYISKR